MPHLNVPGQDQHGENDGLCHGRHLCHDHHAVAAPAITECSRERSDDERGELVGEADEPEDQRRTGELVDEPTDGHVLHPAAHQRNPLPGKEKAQVAVA